MMNTRGTLGFARLRAAIFCGAFALAASIAGAQPLASIEIGAVSAAPAGGAAAPGTDPHPTIYSWGGENKAIKEPVEYYTFFYTGTVDPDATVPVDTEVARIAVPNSQWEANKNAIVSSLAAYYRAALGGAAAAAAAAPQGNVQFDENFNYVETAPAPNQQNPGGIDPRAAAEWTFYYDQVVLWQFYCRRVLLNDKNAKRGNSPPGDLERAARRAQIAAQFEGVDPDRVLEEIEKAREVQSANAGAAPGEQAAADSPATAFDPAADYANPNNNERLREEFLILSTARDELAMSIYRQMLKRIDERRSERERYDEWVQQNEQELLDFARAWGKVQSGERVAFEDTFYLLTKEPLQSVPLEARNVVVREVVTPQDLIDRDGRLKGSRLKEIEAQAAASKSAPEAPKP